MPHRKVYAATADGANLQEHELEATTEDPLIPPETGGFQVSKRSTIETRSRLSSKHLVRVCRRFYRRIRRPVTKLYKKLPWTTRETLQSLRRALPFPDNSIPHRVLLRTVRNTFKESMDQGAEHLHDARHRRRRRRVDGIRELLSDLEGRVLAALGVCEFRIKQEIDTRCESIEDANDFAPHAF